ncbi:hypothetical protein ACERII_16940 [Evansella sp. AB-rgal1]|uniref:hypothetical protein n=1 Tax=Evansella sp. AB-rgal1 TaxID=3242696 RepID=UPI00359DBF70
MELGTCNICRRTGRKVNLKPIAGNQLCPDCYKNINLGYMYWYRRGTYRVVKLMDFTNGAIVDIPEDKMNEVEAYRLFIEQNKDKVFSPAYEYKNK